MPAASDGEDEQVAAALNHHHLLSEYAERADVLPVRYGTAFSSEDRLIRNMSATEQTLAAALQALRNRREYLLTIRQDQGERPPTPTETGRGFLTAKRELREARRMRGARRAAFLDQLLGQIRTLAVAADPTRPLSSERGFGAALLVDLSAVEPLYETLSQAGQAAEALDLSIRLTGPGPCYSFAVLPEVTDG